MDRENRMLEARLLQAQGHTQLEIAELLGAARRATAYRCRREASEAASPSFYYP